MELHEWLEIEEGKIRALPEAGEYPYEKYMRVYPHSTILKLLRLVHLYSMGFYTKDMVSDKGNIWDEE